MIIMADLTNQQAQVLSELLVKVGYEECRKISKNQDEAFDLLDIVEIFKRKFSYNGYPKNTDIQS